MQIIPIHLKNNNNLYSIEKENLKNCVANKQKQPDLQTMTAALLLILDNCNWMQRYIDVRINAFYDSFISKKLT